MKYIKSPLLLTFSPKPINVWEIPFSAISICPTQGVHPLNEKYDISAVADASALQPLKNFSGNIDMRITNTKWRNELSRASELFSEIVTAEGFCYTFNMLHFEDLFRHNVYAFVI